MSDREKSYKNKLLAELPGMNLEIWETHIDNIKEQDVNPRIQSPEMFEQLIETVKKHQRLESLPLCAKRENDKGVWFELISGHHRIRAAKAAGLQMVIVLADTNNLDRDGIISKQLAHNNIDGITDAQLATRLYDSIKKIDYKIEAFMKEVEESKTFAVSMKSVNAKIDWRTITFLFLPNSIENLQAVIDFVGKPEKIFCCKKEDYEKLVEAVKQVKQIKDIKNTGAAIDFMVECSLEKIRQSGNEPEFPD